MALNSTLQDLWSKSITGSTRQAYDTGFNAYTNFLLLNCVVWHDPCMPPISEDYLLYFVAHCVHTLRLKLGTIKLYLCGIRFHYLWRAQNPLETSQGQHLPRLYKILQAVKKIEACY